jgi:wyosine [tRNA(Phe)-imidazoG37] synthetase (radical SAM superfamily)
VDEKTMATFLNPSPVFGPVRSRRLGVSLGVNLMPCTGKICSFDCIYCEVGFNAKRRTKDPFTTMDELTHTLREALELMAADDDLPDVITFAGNGEPTLSPIFPQAVDAVIALRDEFAPNAKVAVLSNGTNADQPEVREALLKVDDNILKLDAHADDLARAIDRPLAASYSIEHQVQTYASYDGHVIIQTMFLEGMFGDRNVSNTSYDQVTEWLEDVKRIAPQYVTIYTIARDTPAPNIRKALPDTLDAIADRVRAAGIRCQVSY